MADFQLKRNPDTGETVFWEPGASEWSKVDARRNPETGEVAILTEGATEWRNLGVYQHEKPSVPSAQPETTQDSLFDLVNALDFASPNRQPAMEVKPLSSRDVPAQPPVPSPMQDIMDAMLPSQPVVDRTDDARAARGFGRTAYLDGLVDAPNLSQPNPPFSAPAEPSAATAQDTRQPLGDLGRRIARGATEIGASMPEAAAIVAAQNQFDPRLGPNQLPGSEEFAQRPVEQNPLFKTGDQLRLASLDLFGTPNPQFDDRFLGKLAEGGGSLAGFVGVSLLAGPLGAAGAGAGVNSAGMYRRAKQEGASEEQARTAAYIGAAVGATEALPITRALGQLPSKLREKAGTALGRRLTNAFLTAGEEGLQEAVVEVANNLTAKGIYDPDAQVLTEGVGEAALIGAILGGGLGAISPSRDGERPNIATPGQPQSSPRDSEGEDEAQSQQPDAQPPEEVVGPTSGAAVQPQPQAEGRASSEPLEASPPAADGTQNPPSQDEWIEIQGMREGTLAGRVFMENQRTGEVLPKDEYDLRIAVQNTPPGDGEQIAQPQGGPNGQDSQTDPISASGAGAAGGVPTDADANAGGVRSRATDPARDTERAGADVGTDAGVDADSASARTDASSVDANRQTPPDVGPDQDDAAGRGATAPVDAGSARPSAEPGVSDTGQEQAAEMSPEPSMQERWDGMTTDQRREVLGRMDGTKTRDGALNKTAERVAGKAWDKITPGARAKLEERWGALDDVNRDTNPQNTDNNPAQADTEPKISNIPDQFGWDEMSEDQRQTAISEAGFVGAVERTTDWADLSDDARSELNAAIQRRAENGDITPPTKPEPQVKSGYGGFVPQSEYDRWEDDRKARDSLKVGMRVTHTSNAFDPPRELPGTIKYIDKKGYQATVEVEQEGGNVYTIGASKLTVLSNNETVDDAAAAADTNPTEAQKEAGNYKKGHTFWQGLDVTIENAKGSERSGTDRDGETWSVAMPSHYGYIKRTEGADGDHVDVYIGDSPDSPLVVIIDQVNLDGTFDEHKVMIGFPTLVQAKSAHKKAFSDGRGADRQGAVSRLTVDQFKDWLENGDTTKPYGMQDAPGRKPENNDLTRDVKPAVVVFAKELSMKIASSDMPKNDAALMKQAAKYFGGTVSEGVFTPKEAYDALELALNMRAQKVGAWTPAHDKRFALRAVEDIQTVLDGFPTQTRRDSETDAYQQFSTPPHYAYAANWVANIKEGDRVLEPSAGNGGIAIFAQNARAKVDVNELADRRVPSLEALDFDRVTSEDAEQIANIWAGDKSRAYDVVVMNPPFSAAGARGAKNTSATGARHIEQALDLLKPGGRLVAIMGHTFQPGNKRVAPFFKGLDRDGLTLQANVVVDGSKVYKKYGTGYDSRLLVIDKVPAPEGRETLTGNAESIPQLLEMMEDVRNATSDRRTSGDGDADATEVQGREDGGGSDDARRKPRVPEPQRNPEPDDLASRTDRRGGPEPTLDQDGDSARAQGDNEGTVSGEATGTDGGSRPRDRSRKLDSRSKGKSLRLKDAEETTVEDMGGGFAKYRPSRVRLEGAKEHPMPLVESAAMATVKPPRPDYDIQVPEKMVKDGLLSEAQLEQVIYAGAAHSEMLPALSADEPARRKGYYIGDGTGVGKTREIAGIIADNWAQGRTKHILISKDKKLIKGARRDFDNVGMKGVQIEDLGKTKAAGSIKKDYQGVQFTTYSTLGTTPKAGAKSRVEQLVDWVGKDFDGTIIFDEAHLAGNALPIKGKRGTSKPSKAALAVIDFQKTLPNARVVYASATAATEVYNLAYADRLGLWGPGTPFPNAISFVNQIVKGGIAAMEVVARDMKQMGVYMARGLSYEGVEYAKVEHELTPEQSEMYDTAATAWQKILQNMDTAIRDHTLGGGRQAAAAKAQFWGSHQRFFQQVLTSMQMPSVIEAIKQDMKDGMSPVIQIVNTNEAATDRAIAGLSDRETLDDVDITPRDQIIQYLENSFPVTQFEEYRDQDGNTRTRPVTDSKGNPVKNAKAVAMRDALVNDLSAIMLPGNPLDLLIETFGPDKVAEVTGRTKRIIQKNGKKVLDKRSQAKALAEAAEFQGGKRDALIFSDAGGTGMDFHADKGAKNNKRRAHYILQAGWRADRAIQGFGRTHRTNQVQPPIYKLAGTNLSGHKRFTSSIARRLDQLGALTKGQKDAGGGMFDATDNLENEFADSAVISLFSEINRGDVPEFTMAEVQDQLGLNLFTPEGAFSISKIPEVPTFLNRLLNVGIDMQNTLFDRFMQHMENTVQYAVENGEFTAGVEEVKHNGAVLVDTKEAYRDGATGATSEYRTITVTRNVQTITFDDLDGAYSNVSWKRNRDTGLVYGFRQASSRTTDKGEVIPTYHRHSPTDRDIVDSTDYRFNYDIIKDDEAENAWNEQLADAPDTRDETLHMVTGALLPIWDRLPASSPRIQRLTLDDGRSLLGRVIPDVELTETLTNLGVDGPQFDLTPAQMQSEVMDGKTIVLSSGHKITRRRVGGELRIEMIASPQTHYQDFASFNGTFAKVGFDLERVNYKPRAFVPNSEKGAGALGRFMQGKNVVNVTSTKEQRKPNDWQSQLVRVLKGETAEGETLTVSSNPEVVRALGGRGQQLVMAASKVRKVLAEHPAIRSHIADLPSLVADPVLILRNQNDTRTADALFVTDATTPDGGVVVVAVKRQGRDDVGSPASVVITVYDHKRVRDVVTAAQKRDQIMYVRGEREHTGYRHTGDNSLNASLSDTFNSVRASSKIRTPRTIFKSGKPPSERRTGQVSGSLAMSKPHQALRNELHRLVGPEVELRFDPTISADGQFESDHWGRMAITVGSTLNPRWTMGHEALHALRHMGVIQSDQWSVLEREASGTWMDEFAVAARYPDLTKAEQIEEAVAEAFGRFYYTKTRPDAQMDTSIRAAFRRISQAFKAIANWARGLGLRTPEDVFQSLMSGDVAVKGDRLSDLPVHKQRRQNTANQMRGAIYLPNRYVWDALMHTNGTIMQRLGEAKRALGDRVDLIRTRVQDRMLPVRRAQEVIEKHFASQLEDDINVYLAEEMYSGRTGAKLDMIDREFTDKIIDIIGGTKGMTVESVGEFLYARHAEERNRRIAKINPEFPDGGSGMDTAQARSILKAIKAGPQASAYGDIATLIDDLRTWGIDERVRMGLMTEDQATVWREAYSFYVPLKGWSETDFADAELDIIGVGRAYNTRGYESRLALGRASEAFNPLVAALTQAQEVAVRSEKNRVGQHLYRLVKEVPAKDLWEIKKSETVRVFNETTGLVEVRNLSPLSLIQANNELAVKVDGKEHRIVMNDPRIARAITQVGVDNLPGWMIPLSMFSRFVSAVNTMLDPEFVIRNFARDTITANINIQSKDKGTAIQKAMMRDLPKALRGAYRGLGGKADTQWSKYFREFSETGGKVSFWVMENPEANRDMLRKRLAREANGWKGRALGLATPSTKQNPVLGAIERVNLAVDNAIRLSAFVNARRNGMTKDQAASLAKNLTVNFNRRGDYGSAINAAYVFANAAMQGSHILLRAMKSSRVRKIVFGMYVLGILLDQANAYLSEEDEDGELAYDKIPDWKNQMNLTLMLGSDSGDAASIWLPYGYNLFPYMGQQTSKVLRGVKEPSDALSDTIAATFSAFSPIQGKDVFSTLTPTALDMANEFASNEDWLGRPIRPESPFSDYGPDAYKYFRGVSSTSRAISDTLNKATGGNLAEPGLVDVSPEYIDHAFGQLTGGAGRFVGRTVDLGAKAVRGEFDEIETRNVPLYRSLQTDTGDWLDRTRYYAFRESVRAARARFRQAQEAHVKVFESTRKLANLHDPLREADKLLRDLRTEKRAIDARDDLSASEKSRRRAKIEEQEARVFLSFNKTYVRAIGPQGE